MEPNLDNMLPRLARALTDRGWRMATAESCTGGWIAKICTDLPGSSEWFERGFVTYSYAAKVDLLGVDNEILQAEGAVSAAIAEQMARGVLQNAPVQASLAATGIAGPGGATDTKPVGTVWFAWSVEGIGTESEMRVFDGDRRSVRAATVAHALDGLLARLERV